MAVVSRVATLVFSDAVGNSRTFRATADVQDKTAGSTFTVTITQAAAGNAPPSVPNALTLSLYRDDGTVGLARTLTPDSLSQVQTFSISSAGTFAIDLRATRTDLPSYDYETDGSPATAPAGFTASQVDRGWIRTTTTAAVALSRTDEYAYGDAVSATVTIGNSASVTRSVTVMLGPVSGSASFTTGTTSTSPSLGVLDKRWPAAATPYTTTLSFANATLTGLPWTTATVTNDSVTVDPRIQFVMHHQKNDNAYATPPGTSHDGVQRLTSDLSFLASRAINARGEGVATLAWTSKLWDAGGLVGTEASPVASRANTAATRGGQTGWADGFTVWDESLPGGTWNFKHIITTNEALGLESEALHAYSLISADPSLRLVTGAGPTDDKRHFVPGSPFLTLVGVINLSTGGRVEMDAGSARVALIRISLAVQRVQYLTADETTWADVTDSSAVHFFTMTPLTGDPKVFSRVFTSTAGWGASDVVMIGKAAVGGVPVSGYDKEIAVNTVNNHDIYKFDGAGFLGFPSR